MWKTAVLANPQARKNKRRADLAGHAGERFGRSVPVILTNDLDALRREIPKIEAQRYDLLLVYGGDGTFRHFYEAWFNVLGEKTAPPPVYPVAGGSQNYVCRDTGTYIGLFEILKALRHGKRLSSGEYIPEWFQVRERNLLRIDDPSAGGPQYAFAYTDGLFYRVGKKYYDMGEGQIAALRALWGTVAQGFVAGGAGNQGVLARGTSVITCGENERQVAGQMALLVSTLDKLLLNMRLFPEPMRTDQGFQFFALRPDHIKRNLLLFPWLGWRGGQGTRWPEPGVVTGTFKKLHIRHCEGYALEGEIYTPPGGPTDLTISLGPSVRLVSMR